jgi:hypothetical protein
MKYLAILFATDFGDSGETLTMSREVETDDIKVIYPYLKSEAQVADDDVDTILLVKSARVLSIPRWNAPMAPEVCKHWSARAGNFEGL